MEFIIEQKHFTKDQIEDLTLNRKGVILQKYPSQGLLSKGYDALAVTIPKEIENQISKNFTLETPILDRSKDLQFNKTSKIPLGFKNICSRSSLVVNKETLISTPHIFFNSNLDLIPIKKTLFCSLCNKRIDINLDCEYNFVHKNITSLIETKLITNLSKEGWLLTPSIHLCNKHN